MLSKIAVLLALFAVTQAHSIEKRETTVTYAQDWREILGSFVSASISIAIITATWYVVAPIFGVNTGVERYEELDPGYYYNYYQGRGFQDGGLLARGAKMLLNSIDLVDTAFNYMDIEDEECRLKTVCEMERYAVNHPLAKLAINTVNSNLSGLSKYQDAIEAGMNNYDCTLLYSQCSGSYFGY